MQSSPFSVLPELRDCRRLFLMDHDIPVQIGVHDFERNGAQRLLFNVDLWVPFALSTPSRDRIDEVLDYDFIRQTIAARVASGHIDLQETLCDDLVATLLAHPSVRAVRVATCKPDVYPGLPGRGRGAICAQARRLTASGDHPFKKGDLHVDCPFKTALRVRGGSGASRGLGSAGFRAAPLGGRGGRHRRVPAGLSRLGPAGAAGAGCAVGHLPGQVPACRPEHRGPARHQDRPVRARSRRGLRLWLELQFHRGPSRHAQPGHLGRVRAASEVESAGRRRQRHAFASGPAAAWGV